MATEGYFRHGQYFLGRQEYVGSLERCGVVRTRFPPEPNGPLHIGHAKALHVNFSVAETYKGECILRFDDTNPITARKHHCMNAIEMINWLGYKPSNITFTSDYFEILFNFALTMIYKGKAYVCHLEYVNIPFDKKVSVESPWRTRPVEENIREFYRMFGGSYVEGQAVLKMKVKTRSGIKDPVAYRIISQPHYRTKMHWLVYPTYDFSHPIVDSLEAISVSLCTTEFVSHRALYEWVQKTLDLPKVSQREQKKLVVPFTIMSKRYLVGLLGRGFTDFDDPRLVTLAGLRRRGIPPQAICKFVALGFHEYSQLLDITREILYPVSPHRLVVLDPLICHVMNYDDLASAAREYPLTVRIPEFDTFSQTSSRVVGIARHIYINKFDFSKNEKDKKHCLTPFSEVHLRGTDYVMQVTHLHHSQDKLIGLDVYLRKVLMKDRRMKVLTWVCNPAKIKVHLIDSRFQDQGSQPAPILSATALAEHSLVSTLKISAEFTYGQTYQAERFAFLTLDPASTLNEYIFNITCLLNLHSQLQASLLKVFHQN
ncbi:hypothetical protein OTU49_015472 [Cherax quadricarinatus]|uniref:Glutamyl/glutaminyl-tRNA synthetase class Ib catalytic domain-containing protein n=3 Tax=Cherax quadricarinatus TaxID=27406 RepID=A0AAW0XYR1_CHEQU